jgi:hypothetical protein
VGPDFDISFTKVTAGALDDTAVTSLAGTITFSTMNEIHHERNLERASDTLVTGPSADT